MGLFGRGKSGGLMNVIRCDEEEYIVWKWRPLGQDVNSTTRENSIRYGSSLSKRCEEIENTEKHEKRNHILIIIKKQNNYGTT